MADFADMHGVLSTDSPFSRLAIVQRRVGRHLESLRGCVHAVTGADGRSVRDVTDGDEWWDLVVDGFGLACGDVGQAERRRAVRHRPRDAPLLGRRRQTLSDDPGRAIRREPRSI